MSLDQVVLFLLLGLGTGAVYSALGLGLVLTYRGSGVINFAHAATAMYIAYVFSELRATGDLVQPIIGLPARIDLGEPFATAPALLLALLCGAALAVALYGLVFRPLRAAPTLAKVVATIGITLVLQAIVVLRFGSDARGTAPILPAEPVELLGASVPSDRFWLAGLVLVIAGLLWLLATRTRFGLATRAAASNEQGAVLLGYSPQRLAALNWVLATVIAGLLAILAAPITGLDPATYTLLIVPALAVAMVAGFRSFFVVAIAGLVLGMVQTEITYLQSVWSWLPRTGLQDAVPLLVIVTVMVVTGGALPTRATLREGRPPTVPRAGRIVLPTAIAVAVALVALLVLQGGFRVGLINSLSASIVCLSLVVLTGFLGQVSLAQMTFAGAAGFALAKFAGPLGIPFPLAPLLAVLLATGVGLLVALPALRIRGISLTIVTLAAAVAIERAVFASDAITGGYQGATVVAPKPFGLDLAIGSGGTYPRLEFGIFVLVLLTVVAVGVLLLRRSVLGQRMLAVQANERAAAAAGISVSGTKILGFTISAAIAGLAGCVIAWQQTQLSFNSFDVFVSMSFLAVAYLGGITSVGGAVAAGLIVNGGLVFTALDRWIGFGQYETLVIGLLLVLTAILNPEGIAGALRRLGRRPRSAPAVRPVPQQGEA